MDNIHIHCLTSGRENFFMFIIGSELKSNFFISFLTSFCLSADFVSSFFSPGFSCPGDGKLRSAFLLSPAPSFLVNSSEIWVVDTSAIFFSSGVSSFSGSFCLNHCRIWRLYFVGFLFIDYVFNDGVYFIFHRHRNNFFWFLDVISASLFCCFSTGFIFPISPSFCFSFFRSSPNRSLSVFPISVLVCRRQLRVVELGVVVEGLAVN